jgi:hypothetical protein
MTGEPVEYVIDYSLDSLSKSFNYIYYLSYLS